MLAPRRILGCQIERTHFKQLSIFIWSIILLFVSVVPVWILYTVCACFMLFTLLFSRTDNYVDLDSKFEASIINSTVYLISMAMQLSTFAVNYKVRSRIAFSIYQ